MSIYRCGLCGNIHEAEQKPTKCSKCYAKESWIFEDNGNEFLIIDRSVARWFFDSYYHPGVEYSPSSGPHHWWWKEGVFHRYKVNGTLDVELLGESKAMEIAETIASRHARCIIEHPYKAYYNDEDFNRLKNPKIVSKYLETIKTWFVENNPDCSITIDSPDERLNNIRNGFNIGLDEEILFIRDISFLRSCNRGLVITDCGLYCNLGDDNHSIDFISWNNFSVVKYKELRFYFTDYNGNIVRALPWQFFFKTDAVPQSSRCVALAQALSDIASVANQTNPWKLLNDGNYEKALEITEYLLTQNPQNYNYLSLKGLILYTREYKKDEEYNEDNLKRALECFDRALKYIDKEQKADRAFLYNYKGKIEAYFENYGDARKSFILALDENDDIDDIEALTECISKCEEELQPLWDSYVSQIQYKQRKFIMPVNDNAIGGCVVDNITVFRISNLPSCIQFTNGHPVQNQIYIGHPYNSKVYVPIEDAEELFFVDRVHELCYLLECLGAEEINITSIKGKSVSEMGEIKKDISAAAEIKLISGEANQNHQAHHKGETSINSQRSMRISLDPTQKPYVPSDLIWYAEQPQWQRLVHSRLNGNMLEYSENLSTSQTKFSSNSEINNIKTSAKYLWIKVNGDVDNNITSQFKESIETQWRIDVKFRSIRDFADDSSQSASGSSSRMTLSPAEEQYKEEVLFMLEDGDIDDAARRMLERKRIKFGVSEDRATLIESQLKPSLTEDEKEYIETYKEICGDGEITPRMRKMLDREADTLGISKDRKVQLENMVK